MKRFFLLFLALLTALSLDAQPLYRVAADLAAAYPPDEVVLLYPEGQDSAAGLPGALGPGESNGLKGPEGTNEMLMVLDVNEEARIELYFPDNGDGRMVVVCPGGGYYGLSVNSEGRHVAKWLNDRGIAAAVLLYRMPNGHRSIPLRDVQNTLRYCRHEAGKWGISRIGVMGFSAGGHLAACASNLYEDEVTRPDFAVLFYPVISFVDGEAHMGSRDNLIGGDLSLIPYYTMYGQVHPGTPETFIALCADDALVPVNPTLTYYQKLQETGIRAELHVFPEGGHGWGFVPFDFGGPERIGISGFRHELDMALTRWLDTVKK